MRVSCTEGFRPKNGIGILPLRRLFGRTDFVCNTCQSPIDEKSGWGKNHQGHPYRRGRTAVRPIGRSNGDSFDNNPSRTGQKDVILVPKGTKELYENAFCWKDFSEIVEVDGDKQASELMAETTGIQSAPYEKDERLSVYSINGVHIQTSSLSELPAGVYVVNGKKVVVK